MFNGLRTSVLWQGIATALLCVTALGGAYVMSDSGDSSTVAPVRMSAPVPQNRPVYTHPASFSARTVRSEQSLAVSPTIASPNFATNRKISRAGASTPVSGSMMMSTPYSGSGLALGLDHTSGGNSGGGGAGSSGASGSVHSTVTVMPIISRVAATAPPPLAARPNLQAIVRGSEGLEVYDGDEPGVITGVENLDLDNPIVAYDPPIGDALWPMLLMVLGYVMVRVLIRKNGRRKETLT